MTALSEPARSRLEHIRAVAAAGSVAAYCRQAGISRSQLYAWRRRHATHGTAGLEDRAPVPRSNPKAMPEALRAQIRKLALLYPDDGCNQLSRRLNSTGTAVSHQSVQTVLNAAGLGTRAERALAVENRIRASSAAPTEAQTRAIEAHNPAFRDRCHRARFAGDVLCVDTIVIEGTSGFANAFAHVFIDVYSQYAFGLVAVEKSGGCIDWAIGTMLYPALESKGVTPRRVVMSPAPQLACRSVRDLFQDMYPATALRVAEPGSTPGSCEALRRHIVPRLRRALSTEPEVVGDAGAAKLFGHALEAWNSSGRAGWPLFGSSPASVWS